jgi:peptidyl-prolyl cis-trans isomerase SurA
MNLNKYKSFLLLTALTTLLFVNINAFSNIKIEVKIDDKIITNFDIQKESEYLKILNPNLYELGEKRLLELSKISLINETIKYNEIQKISFPMSNDNTFINNYLNNLYKKLNLENKDDFENFLKKNKTYSFEEVKEKINIELYWNELIYNKYNKLVKIDENLLLEKIKKAVNEEQKEYNLLEIVFQKKRDLKLDDQINEIKSSIDQIGFKNSANIFSISESSKFGGDLGWIKESSLSDEIVQNLKSLKQGDLTNVLKIGNNYLLLKINEIRINKNSINIDEELKKLINIERNNQLNIFSRIFFNKSKINYSIDEN